MLHLNLLSVSELSNFLFCFRVPIMFWLSKFGVYANLVSVAHLKLVVRMLIVVHLSIVMLFLVKVKVICIVNTNKG